MIGIPSRAISDVVETVSSWKPSRDDPDGEFIYVDLSSVDQESKTIASSRRVASSGAPSRARQIIRSGDVLVSRVRPNLNAVGRVPVELDGATASTGFCVLRPRSEMADSAYLFHWVRSPGFIGEMVRRATGASYPAVSDRIVGVYKYGNHPTPGLTEVRFYAAFFTSFLAEGLRVRFRNLPTTVRHFPIQFSEPSFPPLADSAPSTAVTGSAGLIQTSSGSFTALGGPPTKRSGWAA